TPTPDTTSGSTTRSRWPGSRSSTTPSTRRTSFFRWPCSERPLGARRNRTFRVRFLGRECGMRADRLVAILLLLQSRGQVTAAEVAEELEVSERTARRDLDALGMAGLPIYSQQGRNGGWQLAGG